MTTFYHIEELIRSGSYARALKQLEIEKDGVQRNFLLAKVYYGLQEKKYFEMAYEILLKIYFNSVQLFQLNTSFRKETIQLLLKVSKEIDIDTYNAINNENSSSYGNVDIIRAIYFGGAKFAPSIAEIVNEHKLRISEKLKTGRSIYGSNYFIQFYKNFSSFSPLLRSQDRISIGGGYFLNLNNYGLVIDPGHNFLENFYSAGRNFGDIDGIVVTHFHDDHYADLPSILALIFQNGKNVSTKDKKYDLFLDSETYDKFKDFFLRSNNYNKIIRLKYKKLEPIEILEGIVLTPLKTKHYTMKKNCGVGILININKLSTQIFITGDTGWDSSLNDEYSKYIKLNWHHILVAHISTLYNEEAISFISRKPVFYENHLCIHGLLKCIEILEPNTVILSEIGEELAYVVDDIAKLINNKLGIECFVGMNRFKYDLNNTLTRQYNL